MTKKVLFRVDAGPHIGLGHLQRCLSLATALERLDTACLFFTNGERSVLERVMRFGFEGSALSTAESWGSEDLEKTLLIAAQETCSAIIVDSDCEGPEYLARLRSAGYFVVAVEDTVPHPFPCHLVVNGDAHASELSYESPFPDTQFLLGHNYSILRREFWEVPSRMIPEVAENVLVTLGGSDPHNITPNILDLLAKSPGSFEVSVIIGPFFDSSVELKTAVHRAQRKITVFEAPDSVRDLMVRADLAISAGGQTLYELARVGCPTIAIRMASNQDGQLRVFEEAGFVRIAGRGNDPGIAKVIGKLVVPLLTDHQARASMSAAGRKVVDGKGAVRVAQAISRSLNTHHSRSAIC